ncbi:hypothetical protein, partial [Thioalkalivibrio sp.]|uniref:hypothetical protein n=1 Tax=Thioalkalivibrio sp. TaxID=2093813 RepID=UPI003975B227
MRRFFGVVIGLVGLTFGGASYANTIAVDNPLNLAPPNKDYTVTASEGDVLIEGFWDNQYGVEGGYTDLNAPVFDRFVNLTLSDEKSTAWQSTEIGVSEAEEGDFLKAMVEFLQDAGANIGGAINPRKINEEGNTFSTIREYFWIKEGEWTAYFRNPNTHGVAGEVPGAHQAILAGEHVAHEMETELAAAVVKRRPRRRPASRGASSCLSP